MKIVLNITIKIVLTFVIVWFLGFVNQLTNFGGRIHPLLSILTIGVLILLWRVKNISSVFKQTNDTK